jgi:hypothetical protein
MALIAGTRTRLGSTGGFNAQDLVTNQSFPSGGRNFRVARHPLAIGAVRMGGPRARASQLSGMCGGASVRLSQNAGAIGSGFDVPARLNSKVVSIRKQVELNPIELKRRWTKLSRLL